MILNQALYDEDNVLIENIFYQRIMSLMYEDQDGIPCIGSSVVVIDSTNRTHVKCRNWKDETTQLPNKETSSDT